MTVVRRRRPVSHPLLLFALLSILAWPVFVASATLLSALAGDAWQLNAWTLLPKRVLLQSFLEGYRDSLIAAMAVAALGVIDHLLLGRMKGLRWLRGLLLPLAGGATALFLLPDHDTALLTLVVSGLLLAFLSRITLALYDRLPLPWRRR